jgi:X-Pro dipeptidyl-peptidase
VSPGSEVDPAGNAGPLEPLTEPTLALGEFLALKVPAEDGVLLHVDLQLPEGDGPFPVLIEYTPYAILGDQAWGAAAERGMEQDAGLTYGLAETYVPRGYAVGVAHVRGTGESGGCLTVGGPQEGRDGHAIVEFLAGQPWSNGKVALMGTSYVGTTPIETALTNPPHLTTIIPVSAVTEWYRYYFEHGEQRMNGDPPPGASYPDPALWMAMGVVPGVRTGAASPDDAACVAEYWQNYWFQDDYNAFWEERNLSKGAGNITVPVLYAQGWGDENVATSMIPRFWGGLQSEKRAWFMQHGHGVPASKEAYYEYEHRWLDHWMLGKDNGALDLPGVIVEDNRGTWRAEAAWPPVDANATRLWLAPGGGLAWAAPEEGEASFTDDALGLDTFNVRGQPVPAPVRDLAEGRTFLVFDGEPLEAPMHVAGEPVAHLEAASSATDTQFSVLVYDVDPKEGTAKLLTRGYLDARHREGLAEGKDLAPGERTPFEWPLHPRDHVVEAGHFLRVVVKSSDSYVIPDTTAATNTLFLGPEGSWIDLPLVPVGERTYADEAPRPASWG